MDQALETIRNRIDQLGVRETTVAKEGDNEILVQLPGIQDPERAKELIGKTAVLEFKLVDDTNNVQDAIKNGPPPGDEILYGTSETRRQRAVPGRVAGADDGRRCYRCARASGRAARRSVCGGRAGQSRRGHLRCDDVGKRRAAPRDRARQHRLLGACNQGANSRRSRADYRTLLDGRGARSRDRAALGRAAGAGRNRRGAHSRTVARARFDSPGRDVIRDRRGRRADLHGACTTAAPACSRTSDCR